MDVLSLLHKRIQYPVSPGDGDAWIEEIATSSEENVAIILNDNALTQSSNKENVSKLMKNYNLKAMFDMKSPYLEVSVNFILYVFTKEKVDSVKYGIYNYQLRKCTSYSYSLNLIDVFPNEYLTYIKNIEEFLQTESIPISCDAYEFGNIDSSIIEKRNLYPNRYNKAVIEVNNKLKDVRKVHLEDVAEIIRPTRIGDATPYYFNAIDWKYPFESNKLKKGYKTDCPLKKGDILFLSTTDKIFLMYDEIEEVHVTSNCYVIRSKNELFSPEYLYHYLNSEDAQALIKSKIAPGYIKRIRASDIRTLPVIFPDKSNEYYEYEFYSENIPVGFLEGDSLKSVKKQLLEESSKNDSFVFISYSSKERELAEEVKNILEKNSIRWWMAPHSIPPGSDYGYEIPNAIDECKVFLLILSVASQKSKWVPKEVKMAIDSGKIIVPFHIDGGDINRQFKFYLCDSQIISANNRMEDAYNELVKRMDNIISKKTE